MIYNKYLINNRPQAHKHSNIMQNSNYPTNYPVRIQDSTINETNLVFQLLSFMNAPLDNLTFQDEPLTHDNLHEELLSLGDDDAIRQGFYLYWERDSNLIDIITIDDWEENESEDEGTYEYHDFIIKSGEETKEIILAIN